MNGSVLKHAIRVTAMAVLLSLLSAGCAHLQVAPIEVKPIHIIHDINIRVDKQLDDFFAFQEKAATQPSTTQPAQAATTQTAATVQP
jgi:hypothetical protein